MDSEKISLDDNFKALDSILDKMNGSEVSLEEAFDSYRQGIELLKLCNEQIDGIEKQVMLLNPDGTEEIFE